MTLTLTFDREADAIYVKFRDAPYAYGEDLDHERRIDYDRSGAPVGVEHLCVSREVNLDDLPQQALLGRLLEEYDIRVFA